MLWILQISKEDNWMNPKNNLIRKIIIDLNRCARTVRCLCSEWTPPKEVEIKVLEIPRQLGTNGIASKICTPYEKKNFKPYLGLFPITSLLLNLQHGDEAHTDHLHPHFMPSKSSAALSAQWFGEEGFTTMNICKWSTRKRKIQWTHIPWIKYWSSLTYGCQR